MPCWRYIYCAFLSDWALNLWGSFLETLLIKVVQENFPPEQSLNEIKSHTIILLSLIIIKYMNQGTISTLDEWEIHQPIKFKFCRLAHMGQRPTLGARAMHHGQHLDRKWCQSIPFGEIYLIVTSKVVNSLSLVTYNHFYFFGPSRRKPSRSVDGNQGICYTEIWVVGNSVVAVWR